MSARARLVSFIRNLFFSGHVERQLDEELRAYIDLATEEKRRAGLSEPEARRAVLLDLGGVEQVKESVRDVRVGAIVDQLRRDVRYAARGLARQKGFTLVVVATLALGIGASTAIFTAADTVVFRPLPYADPGRLVKIWGKESRQPTDNVSWPDFADIREQNDVFEQVAADDGMGFSVSGRDGSRQAADGALVTIDWLSTLGVKPLLGRRFLPEEAEPGRDKVVILSHAWWQHRFGADSHIVGTTLLVDDLPVTIVGVLPLNVLRYGADFLKPLVPAHYPRERDHRDLDVFARLKPGVTIAQAQAAVDVIGHRLEQTYPTTNAGRGFRVAALGKYYASVGGHAAQGLLLMLGAVALVLLVACANVTNLLLARAITRSRECVIRTALGATRADLVRQMLVESLLLVTLGGTLGLLVARWSLDALLAFAVATGYVPSRMVVTIDGRVFAFSVVLSLLVGLLSGILPALRASKVDLTATMKTSSLETGARFRRPRASRLLIVMEIAVSFMLLVGAGLMIRSVLRLQATSSGIDANNVLLTASDGGRNFSPAVSYWRSVLERARQFPGVQDAAVTSRPPIHHARGQSFVVDSSSHIATNEDARAGDLLISPDYFRTMGIRLLEGRTFTDRDQGTAPQVVIISESLARQYFPNGDALGRRLSLQEHAPMTCCSAAGAVDNVWREIVGVVADVRQASLDEPPAMTIYRPYSQIVEHDMYLMVRAKSSPDAARSVAHLRQFLLAMDPTKEWMDVRLMQDVIDGSESVRQRRFMLTLLAGFAGVALLLAAVGNYGVMAYAVADRTHEIGIRMALGATQAAVLVEVLGGALELTIAGLCLGALGAQFATRSLSTLLFGVSPADALTYLAAALVLATVATLASYVPARRAVRFDPLLALRQE